jgi:antitoxin (DNA-binding transcriptional repressor) of toxin-antitoxin stability system
MQQISVTEASAQLSQIIDAALVIIVREHHPVVKLTPLANLPRRYPAKAGSAKGLVWMSDDFDEPLEEANHARVSVQDSE